MKKCSLKVKALLVIQIVILAFFVKKEIFAITLVDISSLQASDPKILAVTAAAGLENRDQAAVYIIKDDVDTFWKKELNIPDTVLLPPEVFLEKMVQKYSVILYSSNDIKFLPSIVTYAGVYSAIPLERSFYKTNYPTGQVLFDFSNRWNDENNAVSETAQTLLRSTTTLAVQSGELLQQGFLVDQIIARKMFVEYLKNGCIPLTKDHALLKQIVDSSPWEKPVSVFGYNDINILLGGYVFEAGTNCVNTLGHIATQRSMNLSFLSKFNNSYVPPVLPQPTPTVYSPKKVYVNFVYGDMDNIDFVKGFGHENMQRRVELCQKEPEKCFPLTWTLSPNLKSISPQIARWYYDKAYSTSRDEFIMPPSGSLYSYPGKMPPDIQSNYVAKMVEDANWMGTNGSIHWEWMLTWDTAFKNYFPRYKEYKEKNWAFFLDNVPWPIPIVSMYMLPCQRYKWLEENVVVFKPAWDWEPMGGTSFGRNDNVFDFAKKIKTLSPGTVTYIYVIQNTPPEYLFQLVSLLDKEKFEIVSYQNLISLSKQRDEAVSMNPKMFDICSLI